MANNFNRGMDDAYLGKEIIKDPNIEYLRGYGYAESLYEEQKDDREQPDDREPHEEPNQ